MARRCLHSWSRVNFVHASPAPPSFRSYWLRLVSPAESDAAAALILRKSPFERYEDRSTEMFPVILQASSHKKGAGKGGGCRPHLLTNMKALWNFAYADILGQELRFGQDFN